MNDIIDFYELGLPIKTPIGNCQFLKVRDYPYYIHDLMNISHTKEKIVYLFHRMNKSNAYTDAIKELETLSLFEIITRIPDLFNSYEKVFLKVFENDEALKNLNRDNFEYIRNLILKMNCIKEEKINPNPEIQAFIEKSKRVKSQEGDKITFSSMTSSVVAFTGITYEKLLDFTIYQLYMTYYRIAQFKRHDSTTLWATVPTEQKINVENWAKHIDLFIDEKHSIERREFEGTSKKIFD